MAKTSAPNSAGSQYFITVDAYPSLNENYAAFGNVLEGMNVVNEISEVPTNANDKPLVDVVIDSIRIISPQVIAYFPEETNLELDDSATALFWVETVSDYDQYSWFVNDELQSSTSFILNYTFPANGEYEVKAVVEQNGFEEDIVWNVNVSALNSDDDLSLQNILEQNIPNPFNPSTTIKFNLTNSQSVKLDIFNSKGQLVKNLATDSFAAGSHSVVWNGDDKTGKTVGSGIYFYVLQGEDFRLIRKAILMK